jgi:hypothetical protein
MSENRIEVEIKAKESYWLVECHVLIQPRDEHLMEISWGLEAVGGDVDFVSIDDAAGIARAALSRTEQLLAVDDEESEASFVFAWEDCPMFDSLRKIRRPTAKALLRGLRKICEEAEGAEGAEGCGDDRD